MRHVVSAPAAALLLALCATTGCAGAATPADPGRGTAAPVAGTATAGNDGPGGTPAAPGTGGPSVVPHSGTVSGFTGTLSGSALTLNTAGYVLDPNGESLTLVFSSSANVCAEVQDNFHGKNENVVTMVLSAFDLGTPTAPTGVGTFAVFNAGMTGTPRGSAALVVADRLGGDCRSQINGTASIGQMAGGGVTGTVTVATFESGTAGHLTGSFTVTLRAPDSALTGSFDATRCTLPAAASAPPGCR